MTIYFTISNEQNKMSKKKWSELLEKRKQKNKKIRTDTSRFSFSLGDAVRVRDGLFFYFTFVDSRGIHSSFFSATTNPKSVTLYNYIYIYTMAQTSGFSTLPSRIHLHMNIQFALYIHWICIVSPSFPLRSFTRPEQRIPTISNSPPIYITFCLSTLPPPRPSTTPISF